ncbi:hypothetical protein BDV38DRAFT_278589 [Aspergillus pseudotamarii]|uniref:Up-regulated during septation protein 1 domain-containing protein n=1 Tax=Aspergillus pseudotamarii TaxID=132259 RepID=A0A5N6T6B5_ASPPS|nr:uncharacterized protein BDV38DRAFT_278589 [Aspergillus pseudotamarii]KAE8141807.1 hypothetical protein BDV38DRAFT_278589 [Aspergillus pseudotamarii]
MQNSHYNSVPTGGNDTLRTQPDVVQTSSKITDGNEGTDRQSPARRLRFQLWPRVKQYAPFGTTGKLRARELAASQASPCLSEISTKHSDRATIVSEHDDRLGTSRCNVSIPDGKSRFINTVTPNPMDSRKCMSLRLVVESRSSYFTSKVPATSPHTERLKITSTAKSPTNPVNHAILHPVSGPLIPPSQTGVASLQRSPPTSKCQDALPKATKTDTEGAMHPAELFAVSAQPETTSPPPVPPKSPRTMNRSLKLHQEQCTFVSPWRDPPTSNHGRYFASDPLGTKPPYRSQAVYQYKGPYTAHSGGTLLGRRSPIVHNSPSNCVGQRHTTAEDASAEELQVLEERCRHIRRIYDSLEFELRGLQERTTRFLGSESTDGAECRKNVLIRTKAIADLDVSMKGWASKLEQATNQQVYLRQKLAEHVAATAHRDTTNPGLGISDEPNHGTKPAMTSNLVDTSRRKTESIKVYVDVNVFEEIATSAETER